MIYLDYAATTPVKPGVASVISECIQSDWYNPSSLYRPSTEVRKKIDAAREVIAKSISAKPEEIIFTSGGSEANNLAIQGFGNANPNHFIMTSEIEHKSIIDLVSVIPHSAVIPVDSDCMVNIELLTNYLQNVDKSKQILVSIQYVNNETGVIQDINEIALLCHKYGAKLHVDAVQAYPHMKIDVKKLGIDMMSVSGHKFGCPKGIGFLYVKSGTNIAPLIYGSQERGLRGGTENTSYIIGMAEAVKSISYDSLLDKRLYFEKLLKEIGCTINCEQTDRADSIISCTLPKGIIGELVIYMLAAEGIYVSAGSACSLGKASHVLKAIGLSAEEIQRTVRISFSDATTIDEIITASERLREIIKKVI